MNELFPIIRRQRRPLLVADAPPVMVRNVELVKANTTVAPARQAGEGLSEVQEKSEYASAESNE